MRGEIKQSRSCSIEEDDVIASDALMNPMGCVPFLKRLSDFPGNRETLAKGWPVQFLIHFFELFRARISACLDSHEGYRRLAVPSKYHLTEPVNTLQGAKIIRF